MKCKFCGKKATEVIYLEEGKYHIEVLENFDLDYLIKIEMFFCSKCEKYIDFDKYRIFNVLSGCKCGCLKEWRNTIK